MTEDDVRVGSAAAAAVVDGLLTRPALVHGGLPPYGRDLDLLVDPSDVAGLEAGLAGQGFVRTAEGWSRPDGSDEVDVAVPADLGLPGTETEWLLAGDLPLSGYRHLVRPAPAAVLLLLARRDVAAQRLSDKHRRRVLQALDEEPAAFAAARERAAAWQVTASLEALRSGRPGALLRYRHARERQARSGVPPLARLRALRRAVDPRRA